MKRLFSRAAVALRRWWSMTGGDGYTGGLTQPGDWRVRYDEYPTWPTRWMSYGDAKRCQRVWPGKLEYRHDLRADKTNAP